MTKRKLESDFTKFVCDDFVKLGCKVLVITGNMFTRNNPDRCIVSAYGVWLIEFKNVTTEYKLAQELTLREINERRPGTGFVCRAAPDWDLGGGLLGYLSTNDESNRLCEFKTPKELYAHLIFLEAQRCNAT